MALKELLKQRVMEKLNFSQEISDELRKIQVPSDILLIVLQLCLMSDITYLPTDQNLSPWFCFFS